LTGHIRPKTGHIRPSPDISDPRPDISGPTVLIGLNLMSFRLNYLFTPINERMYSFFSSKILLETKENMRTIGFAYVLTI
jgi:hypothetical protein